MVVNQNIINHANNAVTAYNEAQNNEAAQLTWAEELMKNKGGSSSSNSGNNNTTSDLFSLDGVTLGNVAAGMKSAANGGAHEGDWILVILKDEKNASAIAVDIGETIYLITNDPTSLENMGISGDLTTLKVNTWYSVPDSNEISVSAMTEYTGSAPFDINYYSEIYDTSYVQRIIDSFNN